MKSAIEVYVSIILIVLLGLTCFGFIASNVNSANARDLYYAYREEIQESNCSSVVINKCMEDASAKGYSLTCDLTEEGVYQLTFSYPYKVIIFDTGKTVDIYGYVHSYVA